MNMNNLWLLTYLVVLSQAVNPGHSLSTSIGESASCKCTPEQNCWPSADDWITLNNTVSGKLIATQPVAISCYPGPSQDLDACANIVAQWSNATFQSTQPLGLDYATNVTCPPVNFTAGETPKSCSVGSNPSYAINATNTDDVTSALVFATKHNIRVVVKSTGHDLLERSDGYGSLLVWLRYLRNGVEFQQQFSSSNRCRSTNWTGNAFKIKGGYTWSNVCPEAEAENVVVVGGGTPTVGCMGGWMQGGGHGPASRQFGLGADQVLEAEVVLANGSLVTANACQNQDLFFAIRGGGPGTYGVVVSTTVKAWPMVTDIVVQHLAIAPLPGTNTSALLEAIAILFSAYPDLNDAGFAGYGSWSTDSPAPLIANSTSTAGYVHGVYMFNTTLPTVRNAFSSTRARLAAYNTTTLSISEAYTTYPTYWPFYHAESGVEPPVGGSFTGTSRLFDRRSVTSNTTSLRATISTLAGSPGQKTFNSVELVSGGRVFVDASDPYSGVLPAWRTSHFNNIVTRSMPANATDGDKEAIWADITDVKGKAMNDLAPRTGVYMNEASPRDKDFEVNFYGENYERLRAIKKAYDPGDLFYCPTCVGSGEWLVRDDGVLCRV